MDTDSNQPWIFFWATPDPDYNNFLAEEREFKRKIYIRRALLATLLSQADEEGIPEAG